MRKPCSPNTVYPEGLAIMREVALRRLRALGYEPERTITDDALDLMARMSGGVMREMVSLMREAVVQAEIAGENKVTESAARAAVYKLRRQYAAGLRMEHYAELKTFRENHNIPSYNPICDALLRNLYILSYANDEHWYDVHPNVRPLLEGIRSQ